jgi:hypothetical protein
MLLMSNDNSNSLLIDLTNNSLLIEFIVHNSFCVSVVSVTLTMHFRIDYDIFIIFAFHAQDVRES